VALHASLCAQAAVQGPSQFPSPLLSQRNVINLGPPGEYNYAFINHARQGDSAVGPFGARFTTTAKSWMQIIDRNGYPNDPSASGTAWGSGIRFPAAKHFAGPYVITWDGDGQLSLNVGDWSEGGKTMVVKGNSNGTTTLSGFASVIGISPSFKIAGKGVPERTIVVAVNYTDKTIVVSAAVTAAIGITFTLANNTYTKNSNGVWTNTAGVQPYIVVSNNLGSVTNASILVTSTGSIPLRISSMTWSSGVVHVTTVSNHGRPISYKLSLTIFGAQPRLINGTHSCTITSANTFSFPLASDPGGISGTITYVAFLTNIRIYRQDDEEDLYSGLVFRMPFKQMFIDLNPAAIRFVNWINVTNSVNVRFENRSMPSKAGLLANWVAGPAYGSSMGANQITLPASTGTPGNPTRTPAMMVHGEVVICRMGGATVRAGNIEITEITRENPGKVTAPAHGFVTGDRVIIFCGTSARLPGNPFVGMVELNYVAVTVDVVDKNHFTIGVDTTAFTGFAIGTKLKASCCQYVTLQVGSGNDRVAYPIVSQSGNGNVGQSAGTWGATDYQTFIFDKNIAASRSAGSNLESWNKGCWICIQNSSPGNPSVLNGYVPLEYCAALVAEINALSKAQGKISPIHMFIGMPTQGLQPVDPDYAPESDWVLNAIAVVMNGGGGNSGLLSTNASLIMEFSNETWNFAFTAASYLAWLCFVRNGGSTTDNSTMSALRSTLMCRNIVTNSPYSSRVYKTLGFQGFLGYSSLNTNRATGANTNYSTDAWNTWQRRLTPISFHDACNPASYFDPTSAYCTKTTGTGTFTDDSAMFNGTDNSKNDGGNYTGAANPAQAISNFVANVQGGGAGNQSMNQYCSATDPSAGLAGSIDTAMGTFGKRVIWYEGGTDFPTQAGQSLNGHTITMADQAFLVAVNQSSAWATAQVAFLNNLKNLPNTGPGALYQFLSSDPTNLQWAYAAPDTYSTIASVPTEGAALTVNSPLWTGLSARNQALVI
jgi:hypothetical protein